MKKTSEGGLCSKCSNIIYDFRKKSKTEIAFIHANSGGNVCGLYSKNQLRTSDTLNKQYSKRYLLKSTFYGLLALLLNKEAEAKPLNESAKIETLYEASPNNYENLYVQRPEQIVQDSSFITGQVKVIDGVDSLNQPGVNILIEGTDLGTTSDINGNYFINTSKDIFDQDYLTVIFNFIGYVTKKVTIDNKTRKLNVILTPDDTQLIEFYIYAKPPLHKRVWYWITKPFRR